MFENLKFDKNEMSAVIDGYNVTKINDLYGRKDLQENYPGIWHEIAEAWGTEPTITPDLLPENQLPHNEKVKSIKQSKKQEINQMCEQTIYNGIDIETSQGLKHFSLTDHDQTNLLGYALEVAKAKLGLPSIINLEQGVWYHADGEDHCYWSAEDFEKIENAATIFKVNQLTYCKALKDYVSSLETIDEIQAIEYGMKVQGLD